MLDWEKIYQILVPLDEPTSRLYHLNILVAVLLSLAWAAFWIRSKKRKTKPRDFIRVVKLIFFNTKYWFNSSTKIDYGLYLFNGFIKAVLFVPFLDITFRVAQYSMDIMRLWVPEQVLPIAISPVSAALFSIGAFVWDDWLRFIHHWLMHRVPWLWYFHRTHHSATTLTPITLFRTHPIESLQAVLRNGFSLGVASGVFVALFQSPLTLWTILGVNGFGFMFNFFGATLRHSQVPLSFGLLEKYIISPKQHQIHHSSNPGHFNKNIGVSLSIWDRLFGTWVSSKGVKKIRYGI